MPSPLVVSFLGAFQASASVLLTLSYGFIAARLGMVRGVTAKDISSLSRNLFLPALMITSIGSQLNIHHVPTYLLILIWALTYAGVSIVIGKTAVRLFGLPSWTVVAVTFNNTTSLPLLLIKALLETGILTGIARGDVKEAVDRAGSYFLINSLVSKVLIFSIGPHLLGPDIRNIPIREREMYEEVPGEEPNEGTVLISRPNSLQSDESSTTFRKLFPKPATKTLSRIATFFNPTTCGGIIAAIVGLVPAFHRAAFARSDEGGWLNAWLTSSLRNVGGLFSTLQMFIVGSKLSDSLDVPRGHPSPQPPKGAVITIILVRFVVWSVISIPLIYLLAAKTRLLGDDPILWWSMMLMPVSPPGMILSILLEVTNAEARAKMMVARMLAYAYMVTPMIAFAVIGALKATEAAQDARRHTS